ncbi:MAG: hypothetical protein H7A46_00740 [Verrucomicrobiales bacterium]|nr:hypothetical protein [Verrucomicrobiales bacterium]
MRRPSNRSPRSFAAPLSTGAWAGGIAVTVLLLGLAIGIPFSLPRSAWPAIAFTSLTCLLIPLITSLFVVRGYEVTRKELIVQRLLWQTRFELGDLRAGRVDPDALKRAWKTMGNGGFFGWIGYFRNKRLGNFRALVTDPARSVVLEFANFKLVVSPDDPAAFVRVLDLPEPTEKAGC